MRHLRLTQGSPEWLAHRRTTRNASDAPAVLDCSPYKKRSELVREIATGIGQEFSPEQQAILNSGHTFEALARPLADVIVGEELYPVVGVHDDGVYGASFDGLTMLEDVAFEHKRLNAALREAMTPGCTGADLPLAYQVQMEHQAMVCPTVERILFMASTWDAEGNLAEERHCWYTPNPALRAQIVAGWELLEKDVAAYQPPKAEPVAAKLQQALPALRIEASGAITASNLDEFQVIALDRINSVNMVLVTDDDFAQGDADGKWLREVAEGMKLAVKAVRANMHDVDEVLRVLEQLDGIATDKAIAIEKKVKNEKVSRKEAILAKADKDLAEHIGSLNAGLGEIWLQAPRGSFEPVTKGLKSLASMEDKVKAALAGAMAEADTAAARLTTNRAHLKQADQDWITLFPDFAVAGTKAAEDFQALAALRIGKARQAADEAATRQQLIDAEKLAQDGIAEARKDEALPAPLLDALSGLAADLKNDAVSEIDARAAIGAAQASSATVEGDTITLGRINTLLAPIKLDAAGLEALGFTFTRIKGAVHFPAAMFPVLCRAVAKRAVDAATAGVGAAEVA
ncbi:MAG: endonuclease [Comamonadaceae bacterium]|nr:MAG: endonuclease [Comamonadaceae bacterium]